MLSSPWTFEHPSTYVRPLGLTEQFFYWKGLFEGTTDFMVSIETEIRSPDSDSIFSPANIKRAWISVKQMFPLLGSCIVQHPDQRLWFTVDEARLRTCGPGEIYFHDVSSTEEVKTISSNLLNSTRLLSNDLLACLLILRRTDDSKRFHVLLHVAHTISDLTAIATSLRTFLGNLASTKSKVEAWDVRDRLALSSSCDDLHPSHRLEVVQQKWRLAVGAVIWRIRLSKLRGGQTLPCKVSGVTAYQPAGSGNIHMVFPKEETQGILRTCRQLGMTFGSAYLVVGQVALTRLLCRKYVQGEINEEEWEFRKREPVIITGPFNLRPFLDREWYDKGGASNALVAIGIYSYHLPYMPLGSASNIKRGFPVPSFDELLSRRRFIYRGGLVKKEADRILRNPLQYEIGTAMFQTLVASAREVTESWRHKLLPSKPHDRRFWSTQEIAANGKVFAHGGGSFGNADGIYPELYPLSGGEPVLRHVDTTDCIHPHPQELYLGSTSLRGRMRLSIYYDTNVYDTSLVGEWLAEIEAAIRHYLLPRNDISSHL